MPDILSNNETMFTLFEPKVQNRFIMIVEGVPSFLIRKVDLPKPTGEPKPIDYINTQWYYRGKTIWAPITLELYDPIVPSGAQTVMEWLRLCHESVTGRAGYSDFYRKDVTINQLGPVGDKVSEWVLKGAFPSGDINFGTMDWSNTGDFVPISLQLSYNYALLSY